MILLHQFAFVTVQGTSSIPRQSSGDRAGSAPCHSGCWQGGALHFERLGHDPSSPHAALRLPSAHLRRQSAGCWLPGLPSSPGNGAGVSCKAITLLSTSPWHQDSSEAAFHSPVRGRALSTKCCGRAKDRRDVLPWVRAAQLERCLASHEIAPS